MFRVRAITFVGSQNCGEELLGWIAFRNSHNGAAFNYLENMRRIAALALICSSVGCMNPFASGRREITLYVTEIAVPVSVPANGQLTASITVQTGGCKQFERFEVTKTPTSAGIESKGTDAGPNALCTADIRYEKKTLDLSGPFSDPFTIKAIQPDASFLVRIVRIQ